MKKESGSYNINGDCPKNAQSFQVTANSGTDAKVHQYQNSSSSFILQPSSFPKTLHPSSLRILLWDIDGTLTRSTRVDSYKDYTAPVLEAVFGTAGRLHEMKVSGMTDLQIIAEALRDEGFTHESIRARAAELRERYMVEMERTAGNGQQLFEVLPGVREVLQAAAEHPRYVSALLTGNIEPAAHLKMRLAGLSEYFQLPGAYGDDSYDRRDLPALAAARINQHLGANLEPHQFIVIGDTPNDIACARHFGARVVAVATGRMYSSDDLLGQTRRTIAGSFRYRIGNAISGCPVKLVAP